jgi:poly(A) polymerase
VTVSAPAGPRVLPRAEHPISRTQIDKNALKVLYRLHQAGYTAYLVGGGVRDLMAGKVPKDFDIATSARPNEIRRLFRNARIIGRRFRLAHILFQEGVVEVSTFRRDPSPEEQDRAAGPRDLLITSDNVFGTPEEDAYRRDFTINALCYNIADFSVIDYVGGIDDIRGGRVHAIGDPDVRFQEDPVRMVRACEFAARLDFTIEPSTQAAIERQRGEIRRASPARLTEELVQLMRCGHAGKALQWMADLGLLEILLPEAYAMVKAREKGIGDFGNIVPVVDRWIQHGRQVSDGALLACLLLPGVLLRREEVETAAGKAISRHGVHQLVAEIVGPFVARFALSNQRSTQITDAINLFNRMCEPHWTGVERVRLVQRAGFPDALDLFRILSAATGEGKEALEPWELATRRAPKPAPAGHKAAVKRRAPRRRRRRPLG